MYFEVLVSIKEYKLKFYGFSKNVSSSVFENVFLAKLCTPTTLKRPKTEVHAAFLHLNWYTYTVPKVIDFRDIT